MLERLLRNSGLSTDRDWKRFLIRWLAISLVLHIATALWNAGFQNADEHFQILEFLNYRLGLSPTADLTREFHQMMRSWMQPALYWIPTELLRLIGVTNPFTWAASYRVLSSFIGWLSVVALCLASYRWIHDSGWRRAAVLLLCLTWFLPALHARHSSENLSGAVFAIAVCFLVLSVNTWKDELTRTPLLITGFLLGLSFEFRYQVGLMIAGFLAWLLIIARMKVRDLVTILGGIFLAIALGTCLDRWGYGQWTFAPWNYVMGNVHDPRVMQADVYPWWDYFRRMFTESVPVLAFISLAGILAAAIRNPRHPLTWSLIPFFVVHCLIGHKETRFLFPMAHMAPLMLVLAFYSPESRRMTYWEFFTFPALRWGAYIYWGLNLVALVGQSLVPAWLQEGVYAEIYRESTGDLHQLAYIDRDPYNLSGIPLNFYRPHSLKLQGYDTPEKFLESLKRRPASDVRMIYYHHSFTQDAAALNQLCHPVMTTIPQWIIHLGSRLDTRLDMHQRLDRLSDWTLFDCRS